MKDWNNEKRLKECSLRENNGDMKENAEKIRNECRTYSKIIIKNGLKKNLSIEEITYLMLGSFSEQTTIYLCEKLVETM